METASRNVWAIKSFRGSLISRWKTYSFSFSRKWMLYGPLNCLRDSCPYPRWVLLMQHGNSWRCSFETLISVYGSVSLLTILKTIAQDLSGFKRQTLPCDHLTPNWTFLVWRLLSPFAFCSLYCFWFLPEIWRSRKPIFEEDCPFWTFSVNCLIPGSLI